MVIENKEKEEEKGKEEKEEEMEEEKEEEEEKEAVKKQMTEKGDRGAALLFVELPLKSSFTEAIWMLIAAPTLSLWLCPTCPEVCHYVLTTE